MGLCWCKKWPGQLGVGSCHIGTGDTYAEMVALGRNVDIEALRAYRDAVRGLLGHPVR